MVDINDLTFDQNAETKAKTSSQIPYDFCANSI